MGGQCHFQKPWAIKQNHIARCGTASLPIILVRMTSKVSKMTASAVGHPHQLACKDPVAEEDTKYWLQDIEKIMSGPKNCS